MKKIATVLILGAFFLSSHLPVLASTQNLKESLKSSEQKNITLNKETKKGKVTSNQKNTHSLWGHLMYITMQNRKQQRLKQEC
ncbi:hypothetical protein BFR44_06500 [Brochothrix thermosphacta]|nr:hypothetical protein BFR44_06500 [Brochothrix thermosphacta]